SHSETDQMPRIALSPPTIFGASTVNLTPTVFPSPACHNTGQHAPSLPALVGASPVSNQLISEVTYSAHVPQLSCPSPSIQPTSGLSPSPSMLGLSPNESSTPQISLPQPPAVVASNDAHDSQPTTSPMTSPTPQLPQSESGATPTSLLPSVVVSNNTDSQPI